VKRIRDSAEIDFGREGEQCDLWSILLSQDGNSLVEGSLKDYCEDDCREETGKQVAFGP